MVELTDKNMVNSLRTIAVFIAFSFEDNLKYQES